MICSWHIKPLFSFQQHTLYHNFCMPVLDETNKRVLLRFSPRILRLETTRATCKNNFERDARANSPAHLSTYICKNLDIIVSFWIGPWARAS